jgi:hypothetical protein
MSGRTLLLSKENTSFPRLCDKASPTIDLTEERFLSQRALVFGPASVARRSRAGDEGAIGIGLLKSLGPSNLQPLELCCSSVMIRSHFIVHLDTYGGSTLNG